MSAILLADICDHIAGSGKSGNVRPEAVQLFDTAKDRSAAGDLAGAAEAWKRLLAIFRKYHQLDPGGTFEMVGLWELARCFDALHLSLEAELVLLATLELSQAKFGRECRNNYNCINRLAVLYENLGRLDEAEAMYQRSIAGRAKILGELHWDTAMSLQELAIIYVKLEDYAAARPLLEMSLRGFDQDEGPHRNFTLNVMTNLSTVYSELNMDNELLALLERLIPRATHTHGPDHLITGFAVRKYLELFGRRGGGQELPQDMAQLIVIYAQIYQDTGSEIARWILELCRIGN